MDPAVQSSANRVTDRAWLRVVLQSAKACRHLEEVGKRGKKGTGT